MQNAPPPPRGNLQRGVDNVSSSPTMQGVTASASGEPTATRVQLLLLADDVNVTTSASGGTHNYGM